MCQGTWDRVRMNCEVWVLAVGGRLIFEKVKNEEESWITRTSSFLSFSLHIDKYLTRTHRTPLLFDSEPLRWSGVTARLSLPFMGRGGRFRGGERGKNSF